MVQEIIKLLNYSEKNYKRFSSQIIVSLINELRIIRFMVTIKGYEFKKVTVRDSYNRRALKYKNNIINYFKNVEVIEDDVDVPMESMAMRRAQASVSWYMWDYHFFYCYNNDTSKFVENLGMVAQVIEHFLNLLSEGKISQDEFIKEFEEDHDIIKQRKDARKVLGVEEDSTDFEKMHQNYKKLAKAHHPDMSGGDTEKFQEINKAHKILKKELMES